jgi:hypothetical protein
MKDLQNVLRKYREGVFAGGAEVVRPAIDVVALREDLGAVIAGSDRLLWLCIGCLLILFGVDLAILFRYLEQPKMVVAIVGATGVGFPVILNFMQKLWKQKFATQTITAILPAISQDDLPAIVDKLLASL